MVRGCTVETRTLVPDYDSCFQAMPGFMRLQPFHPFSLCRRNTPKIFLLCLCSATTSLTLYDYWVSLILFLATVHKPKLPEWFLTTQSFHFIELWFVLFHTDRRGLKYGNKNPSIILVDSLFWKSKV